MGHYKTPVPVKLVIGLLGANPKIIARTRQILQEKFGLEEEVMEAIPFTWTNYYVQELGPSPLRSFISFEKTIPREEMVDIKRYTNELELSLSQEGLRPVNIDPGYMTLGQFFLATTKDQRQRVYIRDGIFIEPTLYFQDGRFLPFDWTYPDYRSEEYQGFMQAARMKLAYQLRHAGAPYSTLKANTGKSAKPGQ